MKNTIYGKIAFVVVASVLLAFSGLYASESLPFLLRLTYWAILIGAGLWLGDALSRQLRPLLAPLPWAARWMVYSLILTVPMFGFVLILQGFGDQPIMAADYAEAALKVWVVTAVITGFRMRDDVTAAAGAPALSPGSGDNQQYGDSEIATPEDGVAPKQITSKILLRLQPELHDAELWALGAEDHYVRVITNTGNDLILVRFADAISEADGIEGLRVHRSWWVARQGIDRIAKRTEGGVIFLKNGVEIPISRRRMTDVKSAGWL